MIYILLTLKLNIKSYTCKYLTIFKPIWSIQLIVIFSSTEKEKS